MPRGLSPELAIIYPNLTVSHTCRGFITTCGLLPINSRSCQNRSPITYISSFKTEPSSYEALSFSPPINPCCAECPIARNSIPKE